MTRTSRKSVSSSASSRRSVSATSTATSKVKSKVKPMPNFSKLHGKWQTKLQEGITVKKKPCTVLPQAKAFNFVLTDDACSNDNDKPSLPSRRVRASGTENEPPGNHSNLPPEFKDLTEPSVRDQEKSIPRASMYSRVPVTNGGAALQDLKDRLLSKLIVNSPRTPAQSSSTSLGDRSSRIFESIRNSVYVRRARPAPSLLESAKKPAQKAQRVPVTPAQRVPATPAQRVLATPAQRVPATPIPGKSPATRVMRQSSQKKILQEKLYQLNDNVKTHLTFDDENASPEINTGKSTKTPLKDAKTKEKLVTRDHVHMLAPAEENATLDKTPTKSVRLPFMMLSGSQIKARSLPSNSESDSDCTSPYSSGTDAQSHPASPLSKQSSCTPISPYRVTHGVKSKVKSVSGKAASSPRGETVATKGSARFRDLWSPKQSRNKDKRFSPRRKTSPKQRTNLSHLSGTLPRSPKQAGTKKDGIGSPLFSRVISKNLQNRPSPVLDVNNLTAEFDKENMTPKFPLKKQSPSVIRYDDDDDLGKDVSLRLLDLQDESVENICAQLAEIRRKQQVLSEQKQILLQKLHKKSTREKNSAKKCLDLLGERKVPDASEEQDLGSNVPTDSRGVEDVCSSEGSRERLTQGDDGTSVDTESTVLPSMEDKLMEMERSASDHKDLSPQSLLAASPVKTAGNRSTTILPVTPEQQKASTSPARSFAFTAISPRLTMSGTAQLFPHQSPIQKSPILNSLHFKNEALEAKSTETNVLTGFLGSPQGKNNDLFGSSLLQRSPLDLCVRNHATSSPISKCAPHSPLREDGDPNSTFTRIQNKLQIMKSSYLRSPITKTAASTANTATKLTISSSPMSLSRIVAGSQRFGSPCKFLPQLSPPPSLKYFDRQVDDEVSRYMCSLTGADHHGDGSPAHRCNNPLAKLLEHGDKMHFRPIHASLLGSRFH